MEILRGPRGRKALRLRPGPANSRLRRNLSQVLALGMLLILVAGCARWREETSEKNPLPLQRLARDTVILEVMLLRLPADAKESVAQFWREVDVSGPSLELRRRLQDNGLRCGISASRLPATLEQLIDRQSSGAVPWDLSKQQTFDQGGSHQRWQARLGQPHRFVLTPRHERLSWLLDHDGYVSGGTLFGAQGQAEIVTYPQPNGQVRVDVTLSLEHGEAKQKVDFVNQSSVYTVERARQEFKSLRISNLLAPGQTLLISRTSDDAGLGHIFFGRDPGPAGEARLLLIRLAQTQLDGAFSREQNYAPIESPTE